MHLMAAYQYPARQPQGDNYNICNACFASNANFCVKLRWFGGFIEMKRLCRLCVSNINNRSIRAILNSSSRLSK